AGVSMLAKGDPRFALWHRPGSGALITLCAPEGSLRRCCVSCFVAISVRLLLLLAIAHPCRSLAQEVPPAPDPAKVQEARDKIAKLNEAVSNSTSALNRANTSGAELSALTDPSSDKGAFVPRAQDLARELKAIVSSDLQKALENRVTDITKIKDAMPPCDKETLGEDVATQCTHANEDAQIKLSGLQDAQTSLDDALNRIGAYFKAGLDEPGKQLDRLDTMWSVPDELAVEDFAASVPTYKESCSVSLEMGKLKGGIYKSLKTLKADTTIEGEVDGALKGLGNKLKTVAGKVDAILAAIQKTADGNTKKVSESITTVAATPIASGQAASDATTETSKAERGITKVLAAWPDLETSIKSCEQTPETHLAKLRVTIKATQNSKAKLQEKLSLLNDALVSDPNQFTEDAVPLFFYTEVEKLMHSLNERTDWAGGNSAAATVAASQRELLLDAEARVGQARGEVADLQFELAKLQEQQRQADAATSFLALLSQKTSLTKRQRDSDLSRATEEFNKAQADADADPTNADKKLRLQKATEKKNTVTAKATDATTKESDAKTKLADAQAQQTAASADKDSLAARIDLAKTKLADAQRNMEAMQRSAYRAALTESDAFAATRDQTPYLEAP